MKKFIYASIAMLFLTGCFSGRTPDSKFFMMEQVKGNEVISEKKLSIQVEQILIPDLIYKPQIVLKDADSFEVNVSEFNRWAEPLPDALRQTLIDDLQSCLPNAYIAPVQYTNSLLSQYVLSIEVNHFIGTFDGKALLDVWWSVQDSTGRLLFKEKTKLEREMQDSYSDYILTQSQLVNELAKVIATKISK